MKKDGFLSKIILLFSLIIILTITVFSVVYARKIENKTSNNSLILNNYERKKMDLNSEIETEILENTRKKSDEISLKSKEMLKEFNKEISDVKEKKIIYDNILNREITRIKTEDIEVDLDSNGNVVGYKNLDDFIVIDKDKKNYNEDDELPEINYEITKESDLNTTISLIEKENELEGYKLMECSNNIEGSWMLTWCKEYENNLINAYDCVNAVIDAKDGSIMLFGKNKIEPNTTRPSITQEEATEIANIIISKVSDEKVETELTFFKPNFYFEEGGPYEQADFIRLCWKVLIKDCINVQIDAETGEILGGDTTSSTDYARSMSVVNFMGQEECASLASKAFTRLGYNQSGYPPVSWSVSQTDMDWMLTRSNMFGLYLSCHGGTNGTRSFLTDSNNLANSTWQIWSDRDFGNWHFVYLDACLTSENKNFVNTFHASGSGKCFVGWNVSVYVTTALDFNRRFFPRLGTMSVNNNVVTSLWESRNAGYNQKGGNICDPGFIGDTGYYGRAW